MAVAYADLVQKFRHFDKNSDGYISFDELKYVFQKLDESSLVSEEAVNSLLATFDFNSDNKIQYEEFVRGLLLEGSNTMASSEELELARSFSSLLKTFNLDSESELSKAAYSAIRSIHDIVQSLGEEDAMQVRAVLLADFRGGGLKFADEDLSEAVHELECDPTDLEDEGSADCQLAMDKGLMDSWDDGSLRPKFPASKVPKGLLSKQIARGEIDKAAIKFEVGDEVMALSGKNSKHWIFGLASVERVFGVFNGKIWYGNSWTDGRKNDRIHAQERLKKVDGSLKFQPRQDVEVLAGDSWVKCRIGNQVRLPLDVEVLEPLVYEVILPKHLHREDATSGKMITLAYIEESSIRVPE